MSLTDSNIETPVAEQSSEVEVPEVEPEPIQTPPAPECPACDLRNKRKSIINMGLVESACVMIENDENRKLCFAMSDAADPKTFVDPVNQYAEVLKLGGIAAFNNVTAEINNEMMHNFVLAVEKLRADGVVLPMDVEAAYAQAKSMEAVQ